MLSHGINNNDAESSLIIPTGLQSDNQNSSTAFNLMDRFGITLKES
jgi:hypothetical protein